MNNVNNLINKANEALKEWDILPSGRAFTMAEITDWLTMWMAPAMEELRNAIIDMDGSNSKRS